MTPEEEARRAAAAERAEKWKRTMIVDRNSIVGTLRRCAESDGSMRADDATLAADLLEDLADGRI